MQFYHFLIDLLSGIVSTTETDYLGLQLLLLFLPLFVSFCFVYFGALLLHACVYNYYNFLLDWRFYDDKIFFISTNTFCFKGLFLLISIYPLQFYFFLIFFMWTIFKVFIELFLFYVLIFWHWTMWDLSTSTRDWTSIPCIRRQSLNYWTSREDSFPLSCGYCSHMIYFSIFLLSIYLYIWIQNVSSIGSI